MEGILGVLAQVPEDRLIHCKHKLACKREDRRSCRLLHAMILLTLRRDADARVNLEAMGADAAAACICRSHWGIAAANGANAIPPKEEAASVALAVARIYSLLVDEKLCGPEMRDGAYREAVEAYQASGIQGALLKSVSDEARERCGAGFAATSVRLGAPRSGAEGPPSPGARSSPVTIGSSWDPSALRSTGSLTSLLSHLEISASPTVPFVTDTADRHAVPETTKPCGRPSGLSAKVGGFDSLDGCYSEGRPRNGRGSDPQGGHSCPSLPTPAEESVRHPVQCSELPSPGQQDLGGNVPSGRPPSLPSPCGLGASAGGFQAGAVESSSPPPSIRPREPASSSSAPPPPPIKPVSTDPAADEQQFFTFMVLHAAEDEAIACRVKERLESLGVSNGATFCEDFLIPGRCQLNCFEDALENTAYTLLLLTENFKGQLCAYQTNTALMDSFNRFRKNHTVIPFVPKENSLQRAEVPLLLASLVPLDENSPVFAARVKKTFTARDIQEKRAAWRLVRQVRESQRRLAQQQEYLLALQRLSDLEVSARGPGTVPSPLPTCAGFHIPPQPLFHTTFPAPGMPQPAAGPDLSYLTQPLMFSLPGGPQPLIIQHAQMVQIGDYNHMDVDKAGAGGQGADEDWQA